MFVESISLKNFKSFKNATVQFERGFNSIVGPNGSGKTNVVDALLFAFGESSLKAMRVKKTMDLLFNNAGVAEVSIIVSSGKEKHSISRLIRKDGKQKYLMDGRRVKKYVIEEFLLKNRISLNHVIKQGEVQRIVEMNSKDRRLLIDFVANVSDYEAKKKEALSELQKVQNTLNESNVLLGEKEGFLKELAEEKKSAEKYLFLSERLKSLKATLLNLDLSVLNNEFKSLVETNLDLDSKARCMQEEISSIDLVVVDLQTQIEDLNQKILLKGKGKEVDLQREIDELNNLISQGKLLIQEKKMELEKVSTRSFEVKLEKLKALDEVNAQKKNLVVFIDDLKEVSAMLSKEESGLNKLVGASSSFTSDFHSAVKKMQLLEEEMLSTKERLNEIQAETGKNKEVQRMKELELERLRKGFVSDSSNRLKELKSGLTKVDKELVECESKVSDLFSVEKKLNKELQETEIDLVESRKKFSFYEGRLRQVGGSSSLFEAVNALKQVKGVYGTVQELINFDSKYVIPVSTALGPRLSFVVVDSVKTAGKSIEFLKKERKGRVSFIPLDKIYAKSLSSEEKALKKEKGAIDFLINLLSFDSKFKNAIEFCCGNTLVMNDFSSAEDLIGEARLITLEGELFEQSGLVSGGSSSDKLNPFLEAKELEKWASKLTKLEAERQILLSSLNSNRDEGSEARKKRVEAELLKKKFELELEHVQNEELQNQEKLKDLKKAVSDLTVEIKQCAEEIVKGDDERRELVRELSQLNVHFLSLKEKVDVEKQQSFGNEVKEREHRVSELKIKSSELKSEKSAIETKLSVFEKQLVGIEKQEKDLLEQVKEYEGVQKEADSRIKVAREKLKEKLEEQKKVAGHLKEIWVSRAEFEKKIKVMGEKKAKTQFDLEEKIRPGKQKNEVRLATLQERISGLTLQLDDLGEVKLLSKSEDDAPALEKETQSIENELEGLGQINMRAIDDYERKAGDFEVQKERVKKLVEEREAVISIITEIEGKKIATFMESFNAINKNFQHLFSQIFVGQGTLFLENEENPFEGGLTIKVQLDRKEVKYLELMSGGEKSLIALIFLFAIQGVSPSSVYILDEADAALDDENSRKLQELINALSNDTQFIVVTHNETVYKKADCLIGVAMQGHDGSKLVEVKLS
ncbi:MAG: AAA family ATPase [Candidatus Micrarchaeota archaeon]